MITEFLRRLAQGARPPPFLALFPALFIGAGAENAATGRPWALPNMALPTLGGMQFWTDRYLYAGWRIQHNVVTAHSRLLDPRNIRRAWGGYEACRAAFGQIRANRNIEPYRDHLVVLVHGLGRSRISFRGLERALRDAGYQVAAVSYASTRRSVARNADDLAELLEYLEGVEKVSFVTHSLGALVVRDLLTRGDAPWRDRIAVNGLVMMAPPSRGSRMADVLQYAPPVNLILWRGLFDARTKTVAALPAPDVPFAIVAAGNGRRGWNPLLAGDDDGIVSAEETRLQDAAGWMRVDGIHSFIMNHPKTVTAVVEFVERKRLSNPAE